MWLTIYHGMMAILTASVTVLQIHARQDEKFKSSPKGGLCGELLYDGIQR